jgi:hypothetical protein
MAGEQKVQRFMLWDEPRPKLSDFVSFSSEKLEALSSFIDRYGFDVGLKETLELASALEVSHEKALDLVHYTELLDDQKNQFNLTPDEVVEEEVRLYSKRRTISSGIVPTASAFESLCDLRPVFNEPRDKILDYVSIALIRIRTQSDRQEPNDLIFQIDSDSLHLLEQFMDRLRKKFDVIEDTRRKLLEQKP